MTSPATMPDDTPTLFAPRANEFDYSTVPADVEADLRRGAEAIRKKIKRTVADIIETGRELAGAKTRIGHGKFRAWVEAEVGIAIRTAEEYMAAARLAGDKGASVALLPYDTVRKLAQKSAPPSVVQVVVSEAEAGRIVPVVDVTKMIDQAKHQQREADRERQKAAAARKRRRRRSEQDKHRVEHEARQARELEAVQAAAGRVHDRLGDAGVRALLAELDDGVNPLSLLEQLRKIGGTP